MSRSWFDACNRIGHDTLQESVVPTRNYGPKLEKAIVSYRGETELVAGIEKPLSYVCDEFNLGQYIS